MNRSKILEVLLSVDLGVPISLSESLTAALACGLIEQTPGVPECSFRLTNTGRMTLDDWRGVRCGCGDSMCNDCAGAR